MRRKPHRDTYIKGGIIISYRVCVYAICKNESQFVERFMDSMSEADDICVLDTGSTDDTVEKLRARGAHVEQKVISPWRFDVARSESLKLIPKDADIGSRTRHVPATATRGAFCPMGARAVSSGRTKFTKTAATAG